MGLPRSIGPASATHPLVLLPLPPSVPADATPLATSLAASLHAYVDAGAADPLALNALAAGMRHATRSAQICVNAARAGSSGARAQLDDADAALQAARYELGKVRAAAHECDAYVPQYTGLDIEGIAERGEHGGSGEEEVEAELSRDHARVMALLEGELAAVIEREQLLAELTRERDALVRARREVRARSDAVDVWLADYAKTTNAMASKIRDVTKVTNPPKRSAEGSGPKGAKQEEGEGMD